jgi:hypothetical protein
LSDWLANRWLVEHRVSREEIADLLAVVDRDLEDAAIDRLSPDWRLGISYNAALQLATLALAAEGYRPDRQRAHERAIQSLRFTVELEKDLIAVLDGVRRKRNIASYERAGTASAREAEEMYQLARALRTRVMEWLERNHSNLLTDK